MSNKKKKIIITILAVLLVVGGLYAWKGKSLFKFNKQINWSGEKVTDYSKTSTYAHIDGDFTFEYPSDFTFSDLNQTDEVTKKDSETLLFHGSDPKENFQIVISALDTDPITLARVKKEVPDMKLSDAQEISIQGARGVIFSSAEADAKNGTREIWFSQNGILYQISTFPEFDSKMADILASWKWMPQ